MKHFKFIIENDYARIIEETQLESSNTLSLVLANAKPILDALAEGKVPYINTKTKEIIIKGEEDNFDNFLASSKKGILALKLRDYINNRLDGFSTIDLVLYMDAKLDLADAGFVITDANREEKYLEILETGDEKLIDLLESYLIVKDDISAIKAHKKTYNEVTEQIKTLSEDSEEFKILFNKYT